MRKTQILRGVAGLIAFASGLPLALTLIAEVSEPAEWPILIGTVPAALLGLVAIGFSYRRSNSAQIFSNAIWWTNLVLGSLLANVHEEEPGGRWMAVGCAFALMVALARPLPAPVGDRYAPAQYRSVLTLALILAIADTQTLVCFASMMAAAAFGRAHGDLGIAELWVIPAALAMLVSCVGLYRLKTWGLILNLGSNLAIAFCALVLLGGQKGAMPVAVFLTSTAVLQLIVAAPVYYRVASGNDWPLQVPARFQRIGAAAAVGLIATFALVAFQNPLLQNHF